MSAGSAHRDGTGAASSQDQGLDGRTPMLMADGRTRPLRALRPGDRVYGTRMEGRYRRYMITEVVRCQEVLSTAFLVTLEDGTRLALGADQRLLSDRGWKHVTGTEQGGRRRPHQEWRKGFLAGVFDAEGSCSGGILRISNSDRQILRMTDGCLRHFGFRSVREEPRTPANVPVSVIRLTGGLRERMRFFHAVDPAITRKTAIEGMALKSDAALGITAITPLGLRCSLHTLVTAAGDAVADGIIVGAPRASAP
ncbi:LAGLIDADG family homing endonuclease [Actinomadura chokoriensis]|uniref:LAGLIDADG family homing endonuclease n=1 Tax=Actinomadura chokoriensis TaxID=454156 RepID=UPI0031F85ECE